MGAVADTSSPRASDEAPLEVLLTIQHMARPAGAALYVRDFARALHKQGHHPVVYCSHPGEVGDQLISDGIVVTRSVESLQEPDIIHGNTPLETAAAMMQFPDSPAIYVCHGWDSPDALAPRLPRILRYLAVSEISRDRLLYWDGIPESRILIHQNPVDLERFQRRADAPPRLRRALLFSNTLSQTQQLPILREACEQAQISLEFMGRAIANPTLTPEQTLASYDLVFARGRAALEALACGCAVILCDELGLGELITTGNYDRCRLHNFGRRNYGLDFSVRSILEQIKRYDPEDLRRVSDRARANEGLFAAAMALMELYREVIDEFRTSARSTPHEEMRAMAGFLQAFAPHNNTFAVSTQEPRKKLERLKETLATPALDRGELRRISVANGAAPALFHAGKSETGSMLVRNGTQKVLSSLGANPVRLSYHWLDGNGAAVVHDGRRTELFPPLAPGGEQAYRVDIDPPDAAGEYVLRLTLVQELVAWLDDLDCFCDVRCRVL